MHSSEASSADSAGGGRSQIPKTALMELHGFKLVREQFVSEYNSQVLMYRHEKTGAAPRCLTAFFG